MHTINKDNCLNIGFFQKPHGVFGTLILNFSEGLEDIVDQTSVFLVETEGILVPWFTADDGIRVISSKTALVDLDWIDDEESAKRLSGKSVWVENTGIATELNTAVEDEWTGYRIFDSHVELVGEVTGVNDYSGNLVFTVATSKGELLLPFHHDLAGHHDRKNKTLILELPDGIFDL